MSTRFPLTLPLTPGAYLKQRRTAAGLDLLDVASRLDTEPRLAQHERANWLRLIEIDVMPASFATIVALRSVVPFDLGVLETLTLIQYGSDLPPPQLCLICSCSDADPCGGPRGACWWAEQDLCSHCADPEIVAAIDILVSGELVAEDPQSDVPFVDFSLPAHPDASR